MSKLVEAALFSGALVGALSLLLGSIAALVWACNTAAEFHPAAAVVTFIVGVWAMVTVLFALTP